MVRSVGRVKVCVEVRDWEKFGIMLRGLRRVDHGAGSDDVVLEVLEPSSGTYGQEFERRAEGLGVGLAAVARTCMGHDGGGAPLILAPW